MSAAHFTSRLRGLGPSRFLPPLAVAVLATVVGLAGHWTAAALLAAGLGLAVMLDVDADVPGSGSIPLGYAVAVAVVVLVDPLDALLVLAIALAIIIPRRRSRDLVVAAVGGAVAVAVRTASSRLVAPGSDVEVLGHVLVVGGAFLAVDYLVNRRRIRLVATLYVTLLCAAALLAIAYGKSPALAPVAAVPLLVTRYSFDRLASARRTYSQTTQALSLLPEVAGLTPLGHGERTAIYAGALAEELGLDAATVHRVVTAARLHHIGHISLHEPEERTGPPDVEELRQVSGELLRETGFLADVAGLVEAAQEDSTPSSGIEAAIIRVCSTLDECAEADVDDPFAATLARHASGTERTAAIALLALNDGRPELVADAREASCILAFVAAGGAGADHAHHHEAGADCR